MGSDTPPVKVLYISGSVRSGTTVLTKALGELPGMFAGGELRTIWRYSFINNGRCGCGEPFRDCEVWQQVADRLAGDLASIDPEWMMAQQPQTRDLPLMLVPGGRQLVSRRFERFIDTLDHLYRAVAAGTGSGVIVDSSKVPPYGYLLGLAPSVEVYVVHLVRDPHGVQHSMLRRKAQGDPRFQQHSVARSTLLWDVHNLAQEMLGRQDRERYLRVRYEEFVSDPRGVIERIGAFVGEPEMGVLHVEDGQIRLSTNHTINGSDNRFETGAIPLRLDDRWRTEMDARDRAVVTRLTSPLLRHYGYR